MPGGLRHDLPKSEVRLIVLTGICILVLIFLDLRWAFALILVSRPLPTNGGMWLHPHHLPRCSVTEDRPVPIFQPSHGFRGMVRATSGVRFVWQDMILGRKSARGATYMSTLIHMGRLLLALLDAGTIRSPISPKTATLLEPKSSSTMRGKPKLIRFGSGGAIHGLTTKTPFSLRLGCAPHRASEPMHIGCCIWAVPWASLWAAPTPPNTPMVLLPPRIHELGLLPTPVV